MITWSNDCIEYGWCILLVIEMINLDFLNFWSNLSFVCWCHWHHCNRCKFSVFFILVSRTTGTLSDKLGTKHPEVIEFHFFLMKTYTILQSCDDHCIMNFWCYLFLNNISFAKACLLFQIAALVSHVARVGIFFMLWWWLLNL